MEKVGGRGKLSAEKLQVQQQKNLPTLAIYKHKGIRKAFGNGVEGTQFSWKLSRLDSGDFYLSSGR